VLDDYIAFCKKVRVEGRFILNPIVYNELEKRMLIIIFILPFPILHRKRRKRGPCKLLSSCVSFYPEEEELV